MAGACPPRAAQCNGCHAILSFYQGHARARSAPAARSASITATCPPTAAALRENFAGYPAFLAPGSRKKADPVALKSISVGNRGRSTDPEARYSEPNSKHHSKPPERAPTIAAGQKIQDLGRSVARHALHMRRSSAPQCVVEIAGALGQLPPPQTLIPDVCRPPPRRLTRSAA